MRSAPGDGIAGRPVEVHVESRSRVRARPVDPPGPEAFVGPAGRRGAVDGVITLVPVRRGVHDAVTLDIASAAPFGLQWWTKRVQLPFPSALHVSPRCGSAQPVPRRPDEGTGDVLDRPRSEVGLPRGARPYVPGDARRLVHWRSTAHAGHMMVRELEQPAAEPVTITVELPEDPEAAERVAEGALGICRRPPRGRCAGPPRHEGAFGSRPRRGGRPAQRRTAPRPGRQRVGRGAGRRRGRRQAVSILEAVRRANQPGVPENSIRLRLACLGAVLVAIAACASLQEIAWTTAVGAMVLVSAGTAFSHATRARPPGWVKVMVAVGAMAACVWFFHDGELAGGGHHVRHQPPDDPVGHRPGGALLPRAVPSGPALHARRVGRPDGGGWRAGHRSPVRSLRRGVGLLQPLGPDRNVDLGQRRGPHLGGGPRAGARGDVGGRRRRLPRPPGAGRVVARLVHRPGRRRRLGRGPRGPRRRLGGRGAAVPRRQSRQPDSRRRLSRLCRQPEHGAAGKPGQHPGDAGPGPAPLVLGGGDLRHLAGSELDGVAARAAAPIA